MEKELGIYVHIPFCKKRCSYCDFVSYAGKEDKIDQYFKALKNEIETYNLKDYNVTTIYIGGGTPSFVDSKYIKEIIQKINKGAIELTIEVNPGTITKQKIEEYKNCGINRLSIGLQSTNDNLLKEIGRIHTYDEFLNTYKLAKEAGFENINIDLMIGLPNQTIADLKHAINEIKKLEPKHVSVYSLIVEEGTKIEKQLSSGELQLPDDELERQMYWYVKDQLELLGYEHYEISNFAKKGYKSKHNWNCWEQKEYIGLGCAAHSYLNGVRYANTDNLEEYIKQFANIAGVENIGGVKNSEKIERPEEIKDLKEIKNFNKCGRIIEEVQSLEDQKNEYMLLGLRKLEGVNISAFKAKYIENPLYKYRTQLEKLVKYNLIEINGNYIRLTNKGLDFANLVWEEFV